ncbi:MAG: hypothetical protein K2N76_04620, partial [Muribaculaceae bacterium]|nr:hypothetical protein [Muribaculaceae bacterium]
AQQTYLYGLLGFVAPEFMHVPLICNEAGQRLSKRDSSLSMERLRESRGPRDIIGICAHMAGLIPEPAPCRPDELTGLFSPEVFAARKCLTAPSSL